MKCFSTAILSVITTALFFGCGRHEVAQTGKMVVASFYPVYISLLNIVDSVPGVSVESMTRPSSGCLHDYQMTPNDMKTLATASVFVVNGAGMESFLDKITRQLPSLKVVDASQGIELLETDGVKNGHVWVSISNAMKQVQTITDGLCMWDPSNAVRYRANADRYSARLDSLRGRMHVYLDTVQRRDIITFHEAFPYFAREFGLRVLAVVEREPGSEPSAADLAGLVNLIRQKKPAAIFVEPQYPAKSAETISRETGIPVRTLDPCVSGPAQKDAYLTAMERNFVVLRESLEYHH